MSIFSELNKIVMALAPDADRYNGDPASDVVALDKYNHATFILQEGEGGTGTAAITVEACDDFVPTNPVAIPFKYKVCTTGDTFGAVQSATASGVTPAAGANKQVAIEVDARSLPEGYNKCRAKLTEGVNSPVDAGMICILSEPRYAQELLPTAIA
jgi:hypothetical protein